MSKRPARSRQTKARSERMGTGVPEAVLSLLGITSEEYPAFEAFLRSDDAMRVRASRELIADVVIDAKAAPDARFSLAITESESALPGYSTLDDPHRAEIKQLIDQIAEYLGDSTRKRPFNALMLAAPGTGKSHFIKQIAVAMKDRRVEAVTFNMATMQAPDDMAQPIDELRNLKVNDRFPLLFLDEFDSDPSRYASLLPLLWDGELHIGHRDLRLGKAVIVLAGSNPELPKAMDHSAQMRLESDGDTGFATNGKLVDLLSRINGGVINIPDMDLRTESRDRRADKVCVAVALVKARFGNVKEMPRSLLRFVAHTRFRYGVRSIAHLVDSIASSAVRDEVVRGEALNLPLLTEKALQDSSLKLHLLDKDQGFGIVNRWKEFSKDRTVLIVGLRYGGRRGIPGLIGAEVSAATRRVGSSAKGTGALRVNKTRTRE